MSIAYENGSHTEPTLSGSGTTVTLSHQIPNSGNRLLIVKIAANSSSDYSVLGVTFDAVGLTRLGGPAHQAAVQNRTADIWYMVGPAVKTANVVVTMSKTMAEFNDLSVIAETFSGVDQSTPFGTLVTAKAESGSPTANVTSATGELVTDLVWATGALAVGPNQTQRLNIDTQTSGTQAAVSSTEPGASSVTMSWGSAGVLWSLSAVPLKPGSGSDPDTSTSHRLTDLTAIDTPALEDLLYIVDDPSSTRISNKVTLARLMGYPLRHIVNGRLTTLTTVPVSTSDRTAQSTIYFTPYLGSSLALYDGTRWTLYTLTERSLALSGLTSGLNYDVFIYDNSGTLTLELTAWTNDTTRATALATQDGIYVKTGALTRRYVGTIRTTGTTTTEDSAAKRFVWNYYNRVARKLKVVDTTDTWSYSSSAWRSANNSTANRFEMVIGVNEDPVEATVHGLGRSSSTTIYNIAVGIALDATNTSHADLQGASTAASASIRVTLRAHYQAWAGIGYHFLQWVEYGDAGGVNFDGDGGVASWQCGMAGTVRA